MPGGAVIDPVGVVLQPPSEAALESFITPTSEHYVLAHHGIARCSGEGWTLTVDGLVERNLRLTQVELRSLPAREATSFLECVGNPADPDKPTRLVSNATWRGVGLGDLLRQAGPTEQAAYVWFRGEDFGEFAGVRHDAYVRDIPLSKAWDEDVVVAYEMNGEPLPAEHGFPLRVLVAGWYGTNSVKWLSQISLQAERPVGFYREIYDAALGQPGVPAWNVRVNATITSPVDGQALAPGPHEIRGWAWGDEPVARLDISTDGGTSWEAAELERRRDGRPWQAFRWRWNTPTPCDHVLVARATDATGQSQPDDVHINQVHRIAVTVGSG
jgi:DMSO/TMAO reductase YedYZ molybdopterin-dependent catalytic subunit